MLPDEHCLELLVFPGCLCLHDVVLEPVELEGHAGTGKGGRHAHGYVAKAEDGIVDFLECGIKHGIGSVAVF